MLKKVSNMLLQVKRSESLLAFEIIHSFSSFITLNLEILCKLLFTQKKNRFINHLLEVLKREAIDGSPERAQHGGDGVREWMRMKRVMRCRCWMRRLKSSWKKKRCWFFALYNEKKKKNGVIDSGFWFVWLVVSCSNHPTTFQQVSIQIWLNQPCRDASFATQKRV